VLAGASPQIRNMATTGGNLMQRTRCYYFYDPSYAECNKRVPGSGCAAIHGYNRIHAILGASEQCIAVHPSDFAVALSALGARVVIRNADEERLVPIDAFYRLPGATPQVETVMTHRDLIAAVDLHAPIANGHSHYLKVRDRNSFAFALVSVAAIVALEPERRIRETRIACGGIAPKPWRVTEAEEFLKGKEASETVFRQAAAIMVHGAVPHRYNGFKVELAQRAIVRALTAVTAA
jgi:xanthine dehydrogenase YagS FAD-binding subunit